MPQPAPLWIVALQWATLILSLGPAVRVLAQDSEAEHVQLEYFGPAMGVELKINVYAPDNATGTQAIEAAVARIEELEQILSNYREDSEVNRLSEQLAYGPVPVSDELWAILHRAHSVSEDTDGVFDVTLAPLTDLWREARKSGQLPAESDIAVARQVSGYQKIQFDETAQSISCDAGLRFDFGAIGKGYAADQALCVLGAHGCPRALVDLGGDLAVGRSPPDKPGWRVQIAPVAWEDDLPAEYILVRECGIATSGHASQFVEIDGVRYSHILDPRTGLGIQRQAAITVFSFDATQADALASAFSVLDRNEAMVQVANVKVANMPGTGLLIREKSSETMSFRAASGDFPEIMTLQHNK